jgi:hypothetical protein
VKISLASNLIWSGRAHRTPHTIRSSVPGDHSFVFSPLQYCASKILIAMCCGVSVGAEGRSSSHHVLRARLPLLSNQQQRARHGLPDPSTTSIERMRKTLLSHCHLLTDGDNEIQTLEASMMTAGKLTATRNFWTVGTCFACPCSR